MDPVSLFDLAALQARWLSARQSALAGNIANANTPGYRSRDVAPFAELLDARSGEGSRADLTVRTVEERGSGEVAYERELARTSDVRAGYELNAAIVRAFHRMTLQVARP